MIEVIFTAFYDIEYTFLEVLRAIAPLTVLFIVSMVFLLETTREQIIRVIVGLLFVLIGLTLFLQGVYTGLMPVGEKIGIVLSNLSYSWMLIPLGFVLGFVVIMAEPAVRVLNYEVEKGVGGYITQNTMLITLCIGVGISVALAMARVLYGIPLMFLLVPGYILAFILTKFCSSTFVAIAFDSGGAATGPMTVTFILTMALGVTSNIEGRDPLLDGFGLISLVALAPIITVLLLGTLYSMIEKKNARQYEEV